MHRRDFTASIKTAFRSEVAARQRHASADWTVLILERREAETTDGVAARGEVEGRWLSGGAASLNVTVACSCFIVHNINMWT